MIRDLSGAPLGVPSPADAGTDLSAVWADLASLEDRGLLAVPAAALSRRMASMEAPHRKRWRTLRAIGGLPGVTSAAGARALARPGTVPRMRDLIRAAAVETGVSEARIASGSRESDAARARGMAAWAAREAFGLPASAVAQALGVTPSGAATAIDRTRIMLSRYPAFARAVIAIADAADDLALETSIARDKVSP